MELASKKPAREYKIGDIVKYVDEGGVEQNAIVIYVGESCLNIAYVDPKNETASYRTIVTRKDSVPFYREWMSGNYIK